MITVEERIARLEAKAEYSGELLQDIDNKLSDLSTQFHKYKGFMGGVIFTVSALWTIVLIAVDFLWKH